MPYFDPYSTYTGPFAIPTIIRDLVEPPAYDDLRLWRNHLDLFEVDYVVCMHSNGSVKLETESFVLHFDSTNNYKYIGME